MSEREIIGEMLESDFEAEEQRIGARALWSDTKRQKQQEIQNETIKRNIARLMEYKKHHPADIK